MKSYFFNAHITGIDGEGFPIYDREYAAEDHANYYAAFFTNGLFLYINSGACLVTASGGSGGEPRKLTVAPGRVFVNGYQGVCEGDDVFIVSDLPNGYYRVMVRLDKGEEVRAFECELVFGSGSAYPSPVRSGNIYELCLASVIITDGVPALVDTRTDTALCGAASLTVSPDMLPAEVTQSEAQGGTLTLQRMFTPQRVAQAARALAVPPYNGVGYGTCATAAATAAKVGALANFVRYTGAVVCIRFTVANTAATPTLDVNGTGAAQIRKGGAALTDVTQLIIGDHVFMFDGTYWDWIAWPTALSGTATLPISGWTNNVSTSGYYYINVTMTGVLATDMPFVNIKKNGTDAAADTLMGDSWSKIELAQAQANAVRFFAKELPTVAISLEWKVSR